MDLSKMLRTVLITSAVLLLMTQGAWAVDIGYQSTHSMRGVAIPRLNLWVERMPYEFAGEMATKVRFSDGQNWITLQLGHFGYAPGRHAADLRFVYKRAGGTTQTLLIGRTQKKSHIRLRRVVQSTTGVTFTIYWQPAGQAYQEITRRIALPWAGLEAMRAAVSIPESGSRPETILFWTAGYQLGATTDWLTRVGWQILPGTDDPRYSDDLAFWHVGCTPTGTACWVESQE